MPNESILDKLARYRKAVAAGVVKCDVDNFLLVELRFWGCGQ